MQEILVLMAVNEMGEHHARVVDGDDLREVNEALDWIQESDVYLIVIERVEYKVLVYVENGEALRWIEKDEFAWDAEREVIHWMRRRAVDKLSSLR